MYWQESEPSKSDLPTNLTSETLLSLAVPFHANFEPMSFFCTVPCRSAGSPVEVCNSGQQSRSFGCARRSLKQGTSNGLLRAV